MAYPPDCFRESTERPPGAFENGQGETSGVTIMPLEERMQFEIGLPVPTPISLRWIQPATIG